MQYLTYRCSFGMWLIAILFTLASVDHAFAESPRIGLEGWLFTPAEVTIQSGESVTWYNNDTTNHDIAFEEGIEGRPTVEKPHKIRKRKEYTLTFTKPGAYKYFCKIHLDYDMKGTIIVKP